jgi:3-hydroxyacyl-[acyl-carrier-protein] dehydratase
LRDIREYAGIFLPTGVMLQVDRVVEVSGERIVCEADLSNNWVFPLHFPGSPIFPGSLLIEGAGQTIAIWAWENDLRGDPRLVRVQAEFRCPVIPEHGVITYAGTVRRKRNLCVGRVDVLVDGRVAAHVEGSLIVTAPASNGGAAGPCAAQESGDLSEAGAAAPDAPAGDRSQAASPAAELPRGVENGARSEQG